MSGVHVAYDVRSGRIIRVHHGGADASHVRQAASRHAKIADEQIAVLSAPSHAFEAGKQYKVDVKRQALVEATLGEGGVGGRFGEAGRSR